MTKMGLIQLVAEAAVTFALTFLFPFSMGLRIRLVLAFILLSLCCQRYKGKSLLVWDEIRRIFIVFGSYYFTTLFLIPFREFVFRYFLQITLFVLLDFVCIMICTRYLHLIFWNVVKKPVLIIGAGQTAQELDALIGVNRFSLLEVKGFINCNGDSYLKDVHQQLIPQRRKVYPLKDLEKIVKREHIDTAIVAIPEMSRRDQSRLNQRLSRQVNTVKFLPVTESMVTFDSKIDDFDGTLMISTTTGQMNQLDLFLKRLVDLAAGAAGCLVLGPLYFYVRYLNHKNGDYGPVIFTQNRIGKNGREFKMIKFRTMVENADEILEQMLKDDPEVRKEYEINKKLENDPRVTPAGEFLRKKSLDEFPQFIHVLSGKMSLVGPRPYLPREKADMTQFYDEIIQLKPGVTGMWQTHGRSDVTFEERMELDAYYYRNWNMWLDMVLLIKTIKPFITGKDKGAR